MTTANIGAGNLEENAGGITLFGVTLSTRVLGIILAVAGVLGAGYITATFTLPLKDQVDQQQGQITTKEASVKQKQQQINTKGDLTPKVEAAKRRNNEALALLPDPDNMDVLLRDISAQLPAKIVLSNALTSIEVNNLLEEYKPGAVVAGSGGDAQFRTRTFSIKFSSTYPETINTMRKIERLRPLLVAKNLSLQKVAVSPTNKNNKNLSPEQQKAIIENLPTLLSSTFTIVAYVPLSAAELKAAEEKAAADAAKTKK